MLRAAAARLPLVAGLALLTGCSRGAETSQAKPPAVPVRVAPVVQKDAPVELRAIGTVEAYQTVSIRPQIEGQIAKVAFTEGQEVKTGDLLFQLDTSPFEAALREAEAKLAMDRATAENASVEADRFRRLISDGIVSKDEHDQARTRAASSAAAVKGDEAAVERARIQLGYCSIHSPLDGRVGRVLVHVGNIVKEKETTLAVVNQVRPVRVAFAVPQQDLGRIRGHMAEGTLAVEAAVQGDEARNHGTLSFVDNTVDTTTGTVLLKGEFTNETERLWPGQFVDVTLTLAIEHDVLTIPAHAVQTGQEGQYVFVVKADGTVDLRPVKVRRGPGTEVVVDDGLAAGERVVIEGQLRLAPGIAVEVRDKA
jgi:multidrug efflux system membrane fusion protein